MNAETYNSVWDALEDNPVEAKNMKLRSELMIAIKNKIESEKITQTKAAQLMEITQPRVSALLNGKIENFRIDMLVNMAHRIGLTVSVDVAA